MLRISEKNWLTQAFPTYWKRFVAWATGFVHKYRYDPFFRTELGVVGLLIAFTLFILFVLATGFGVLKIHNAVGVVVLIACGSAFFIYLITRLALAPARNALESQKQFIGNIAHELRTPLAVIKTNTEVALLESDVPQVFQETLTDTITELDRISDIINNLLSLNVLVQPEDIHFGNVNLEDVVDRVTNHLNYLIDKKNQTLIITGSEYQTVWGNTVAIEQIVMNVLKNAVNYTPPGGTVRVSSRPDYRGHVVLTIEDTGVGIEEKDLKRVFEPFFRGDQSRTRGAGGSGLGLAIVNELIKIHRGTMIIRSAKDHGTSVFISLPCGHDQGQPAPLTERRSSDVPVKNDRRKHTAEVAMDYSRLPTPRK